MENINTPRVEVDMSLGDKIAEFFEPIFGRKLERLPILSGILGAIQGGFMGGIFSTAATGITAFNPAAALIGGLIYAGGSLLFDVRHWTGKRSQLNG